jgi:hypothetical protein
VLDWEVLDEDRIEVELVEVVGGRVLNKFGDARSASPNEKSPAPARPTP